MGLREAASQLSPASRSLIFLLTLVGFGSKAGMMPLLVWLPRAHPEAPSHVSALMSAALVNLGLYGVLRVGFDLLGGGARWWWVLVLAVGGLAALYGVLQASVATDLKRVFAYSTSENLGLIFVGVGAAGMFAADGNRTLASLLLIAALLHTVNHAAFKPRGGGGGSRDAAHRDGHSAVGCVVLAVAPLLLIRPLSGVLATMPSIGQENPVTGGAYLQLTGITGSMAPVLIALSLVVGATVLGRGHSRAERATAPPHSPGLGLRRETPQPTYGIHSHGAATTASCSNPPLQAVADLGLLLDVQTLHLDRGYDSNLTTEHCQNLGLTDVVCAKKRRKGEPKTNKPLSLGMRW